MTNTVYTFGYAGLKAGVVEQVLDLLDAELFDIRYSAGSMNPDYSGKRLRERFGFRYNHVGALGNVNYRDDNKPILIANFGVGLVAIRSSQKPVVLMCACQDYGSCHRHTVSRLLADEGIETTELSREWLVEQGFIDPPKQKKPRKGTGDQLTLFGGDEK